MSLATFLATSGKLDERARMDALVDPKQFGIGSDMLDASLSAKVLPMTASGDMIYGGASGVPTRLPKGTDTNILTMAAGIPSWAAAPAAGIPAPTLPTAGGLTRSSHYSVPFYCRFDWTNAMIVALTGTKDKIKVCTIAANTLIFDATLQPDTLAAGVTALTAAVGYTATAYAELVQAADLKQNTNPVVYGDSNGHKRGTALASASAGASGTTDIYVQFDAGSDNLSSVTGSTGHIELGLLVRPTA